MNSRPKIPWSHGDKFLMLMLGLVLPSALGLTLWSRALDRNPNVSVPTPTMPARNARDSYIAAGNAVIDSDKISFAVGSWNPATKSSGDNHFYSPADKEKLLGAVGVDMAERLRAAMDMPADAIEGYGKGAIVGANGELEHGALWHVPGGYAMRELLGWKGDRHAYAKGGATLEVGASGAPSNQTANALSIVPSTKKVGAPGTALDVPLTHINASYVRSHFDAIEVRVPGAPLADEIVFILAMSTGARIHARVGGLSANAISKWDGLR